MKPRIKTFRLTMEYDGTRYSGWQEQANARTITGEVREALETVFGAEVELQGAGRTDAGVHALGQVAHVRVDASRNAVKWPAAKILAELNELLPADIAALNIEPQPHSFHARHDAVRRSYVYQIATRKSAFSKRHVWWIKQPLDVDAMREAAAKLAGRHDFVCFRAKDPSRPEESTIVVVDEVTVEPEGALLVIRFTASHFLWRMVRRVTGVLVKLGLGEITREDFDQLLTGRPDPRLDVAAWTAPAAGLFLESVEYGERAVPDDDVIPEMSEAMLRTRRPAKRPVKRPAKRAKYTKR